VASVPVLRPLRDEDAPDVLALNEANVRMLAPLDEEGLRRLQALSDRFDVLEVDDEFAGFVVTMAAGGEYDSPYYSWFSENVDGFYYLDRIVLSPRHRRLGLGGFVYDEMERAATPYGRMCLEVNLIPRNDASLAFHAARGYVELDRFGDDEHLVSLMEKVL
jgi:predicted GNAT superfamily acetyltransferase